MLSVPVRPDMVPTTWSLGPPLGVVLLSTGALAAEPKLNVPAFTFNTHGTVMALEARLLTNDQFAPAS